MSLEHRAQSVEQKMRPQNFVKIAGGAGSRRLTEGVLNSSLLTPNYSLLFNAGGMK